MFFLMFVFVIVVMILSVGDNVSESVLLVSLVCVHGLRGCGEVRGCQCLG